MNKGFSILEALVLILVVSLIVLFATRKTLGLNEEKNILDNSSTVVFKANVMTILENAENKYSFYEILGKDEITCDDIITINKENYKSCTLKFIDEKAYIEIEGLNKFKDLMCKGTIENLSCN